MTISNILRPIIAIASISSAILLTPAVSHGTTIPEITNLRGSNSVRVGEMANTENRLNRFIANLRSKDGSDPFRAKTKERYLLLLLSGIKFGLTTSGIVWYRRKRNKVFVKPNQNLSLPRLDDRTIHCAKCQQPLIRIRNIELNPAQQVAQKLGGVSYRGYQCPRCSQNNSYSIVAYFSQSDRFDNCPHCQELTMIRSTQILEKATHSHSGKALIVKKCDYCNYQTEDIANIPRLIRKRDCRHRVNNVSNYAHSHKNYTPSK